MERQPPRAGTSPRVLATASALAATLALGGCPEVPTDDAHPFDLSFNSWSQQRVWGPGEPCCDLEVAFLEVEEDDGYGAGAGCVIEIPGEPGSCALTRFDRDQDQADGCMNVRGSLAAGEEVYLSSADRDYELVQEPVEEGGVVYRLPGCPAGGHPEGVALDLLVPGGGAHDPVPGFALEGNLGVGPGLELLEPATDGESLAVPTDEDLDLVWEHTGEIPGLANAGLHRETVVFIRNQEPDMFLFEALACLPDAEGQLTIPAAELSALTPPGGDAGDVHTSLQLDVTYTSEGIPMPFGSVAGARSGVSLTGVIRLDGDPE